MTSLLMAFEVRQVLLQSTESYQCETDLECSQAVVQAIQAQMRLMSDQVQALRDQAVRSEKNQRQILDAYNAQSERQAQIMKLQLELIRENNSFSGTAIFKSLLEYGISLLVILIIIPVAQWMYIRLSGRIRRSYTQWQLNRTVSEWTRAQAECLRHACSGKDQSVQCTDIVSNGADTFCPNPGQSSVSELTTVIPMADVVSYGSTVECV